MSIPSESSRQFLMRSCPLANISPASHRDFEKASRRRSSQSRMGASISRRKSAASFRIEMHSTRPFARSARDGVRNRERRSAPGSAQSSEAISSSDFSSRISIHDRYLSPIESQDESCLSICSAQ